MSAFQLAELSSAIPKSGGQYNFSRRAIGAGARSSVQFITNNIDRKGSDVRFSLAQGRIHARFRVLPRVFD